MRRQGNPLVPPKVVFTNADKKGKGPPKTTTSTDMAVNKPGSVGTIGTLTEKAANKPIGERGNDGIKAAIKPGKGGVKRKDVFETDETLLPPGPWAVENVRSTCMWNLTVMIIYLA